MEALIQRVSQASVSVNNRKISGIDKGLLVFLGIGKDDSENDIPKLTEKIINMRIFDNETANFDRSFKEIGGEILLVSQFTLYGNCTRGRRPDFINAAPSPLAKKLYDATLKEFNAKGIKTAGGEFQAHMHVSLVNDGPVTLIIET